MLRITAWQGWGTSHFTLSAFLPAAVLWFESGSFLLRVTTLIQRSVALCRDDFTASRLAALAAHYGATVACFAIAREGFDRAAEQEANAYVERIHRQRLHQRGRRPSVKSKSKQ